MSRSTSVFPLAQLQHYSRLYGPKYPCFSPSLYLTYKWAQRHPLPLHCLLPRCPARTSSRCRRPCLRATRRAAHGRVPARCAPSLRPRHAGPPYRTSPHGRGALCQRPRPASPSVPLAPSARRPARSPGYMVCGCMQRGAEPGFGAGTTWVAPRSSTPRAQPPPTLPRRA